MTQLFNYEAEQGILGGALLSPEKFHLVSDMLDGKDFHHLPYGMIFDSIKTISGRGQPIDLLVLKEELAKLEQFDAIGGYDGLAKLTDEVPTGAHLEHYGKIVLDYSNRRNLVEVAESLRNDANDKELQPDDVIERAEAAVFAISERGDTDTTEKLATLLKEQYERIERQMENGTPSTGLTTGYPDLDEWLTGMHEEELIIVAGRPAMGKTTLMLNMIRRMAMESHPAMLFSLEMSSANLTMNMTAAQSRINGQTLRKMNLCVDDHGKLISGTDQLSMMDIYIDSTGGLNVDKLRARARRAKSRYGIKALFVDYLQLLTVGDTRTKNREQQIAEVSRKLKGIAKELHIPVVAGAQISRESAKRADPTPMLHDLRESGAIENDADVVLMLHRPGYYDSGKGSGKTEVHITKQRNGPTGMIELSFIPDQFRVEPAAPNHYADNEGYKPTGEGF